MLKILLLSMLSFSCASTQTLTYKDFSIKKLPEENNVKKYSYAVVYGDSLSDTHNIYKTTFHLAPSHRAGYEKGRFSNGPMWIDYFEQFNDSKLVVYNMAFGGAKITETSMIRPSVEKQVMDSVGMLKMIPPKETLLVIWGGGNDYLSLDNSFLKTDGSPDQGKIESFVDINIRSIAGDIEVMKGLGFLEIALVNVPRLSTTPHAKDKGKLKAAYDLAVIYHNDKLLKLAGESQAYLFDAFKINEITNNNLTKYGFKQLGPDHEGGVFGLWKKGDKTNSKFYDDLHPNYLMHYYYAEQFNKDLSMKVKP